MSLLLNLEPWQLALLILPALINLWAIWSAFHREFDNPIHRILWVALAIFVPVLGGLGYIVFGYRQSRPIQRKE